MAAEFQGTAGQGHVCPLPWPTDPEVPEGHVCECGQRWVYQPARWEGLYTLQELRRQQEAGAFLRGIIPTLPQLRQTGNSEAAALSIGDKLPDVDDGAAVVVLIGAMASDGNPK